MIKTTYIKSVRPSKSQGLNTLSVCKIKKVFKTKEHLKKMEIQEFKSKNTTPSVVASVVQSINCSLVIFFHVARKDSFSDQSLVIYSVLWSKDYPLTWWESETQKRALLWKKALQIPQILLEFPQASLRQHSVCKHSCRPVRRRHPWVPFFLLPSPSSKAGQLSWSCFVNGSGATATPCPCMRAHPQWNCCFLWWQSIFHGGRLVFWHCRNWLDFKKKVQRKSSKTGD